MKVISHGHKPGDLLDGGSSIIFVGSHPKPSNQQPEPVQPDPVESPDVTAEALKYFAECRARKRPN